MPVIIHKDLPASEILKSENVFVMDEDRASSQDIRPLRLGILNLMPTKVATETQLLRLISNSPLQIEIDLVRPISHQSKNTPEAHLEKFYTDFYQIKDKRYDGFIVTGAPVEKLDFQDVDYWDELTDLFDFLKTNVFSTVFICWGAQAALYYYYGIGKHDFDHKLFGVFETKTYLDSSLTKGFDDYFYIPHSRHTYVKAKDIEGIDSIEILAGSEETGPSIFATEDKRFIFLTGHGEYDKDTLDAEYKRDLKLGLDIKIPDNYYINDDPAKGIEVRWRGHYNLLFANWINHCVYQPTPYYLEDLEEKII